MNRAWILLSLLLVTLSAGNAHAKTRVAVHEFFGPHASLLRARAERLLLAHRDLEVVTKPELDAAARALGIDVFSPQGRKTMARELMLSAWLTGVVRKQAHGLRLTVVVYDGAEHANVGRAVMRGRSAQKLASSLQRELWPKSKDALLLALAPLPPGRAPIEAAPVQATQALPVTTPPAAAETPIPEAEPPTYPTGSAPAPEASSFGRTIDSASAAPAPAEPRREALHASLSLGSPYRKLAYFDPVSSSLGDSELAGAPMLDLSILYYPGRTFTERWPAWIGIDLAGQLAVRPASAVDRNGNDFRASYHAFRAGLRVRAPIQQHHVSVFSGYAAQRLAFASETKGVDAPTPDVDYRMVRTGAGGELQLMSALVLALDAAWLHVLSVGEIGRWFPRARAGGFELALRLRYALGFRMFAQLSAAYQHTRFAFHARSGDANVARGASDQFLTASLGIGVGI